MRPLLDKCHATPFEDMDAMFELDTGKPVSEWFDDFEREPIGVASLAQVHVARDRQTGKKVAVKLQHPSLADFCDVDMAMVEFCLGKCVQQLVYVLVSPMIPLALAWVKKIFPEFEFTWLGEEMRENLPKELNFIHEASNAEHLAADFDNTKTSLYVPKVLFASKRVSEMLQLFFIILDTGLISALGHGVY